MGKDISVGRHLARLLFGACLLLPEAGFCGSPDSLLVYVGTYTGKDSKGIYGFRMDSESGALSPLGLLAEAPNPSFLAAGPGGRVLYAVEESRSAGGLVGVVDAFAIDPANGSLRLLNRQATGAPGLCHLSVDAAGRHLLAAGYSAGHLAVLPVLADGSLGAVSTLLQHSGSSVNPKRQAGPHAHCVSFAGDGRFAFSCDLGLDKVLVYRYDSATGSLSPNEPPSAALKPGAGPRHVSFHPSGRFAYVINELDSTITAFSCDLESGTLSPLQSVSSLPEGFAGQNSTAEIEVHPSGRFLYGSNRGHDSLLLCSIDAGTGKLSPVAWESTRGRNPRHFEIDPSGRFLLAANQDSGSLSLFRIDAADGRLSFLSEAEVPKPVCARFVRINP